MTGTYFVLPPSHRLFAVFDDAGQGRLALDEIRKLDSTESDDTWIFSGEEGLKAVDPGVGRHGVAVGIVRAMQHMLTSDCEYCEGLAEALRAGAVVVAVKVDEEAVEEVSQVLRQFGGHSLAYGAHWNFVPLPHATHTTGAMSDFVSGSGV